MTEPSILLAELALLNDPGPSPAAMPQKRAQTAQTPSRKGKTRPPKHSGRPREAGPENGSQQVEGWHEARATKGPVRSHPGNRQTLGYWHALHRRPRPLLTSYERWPGLVDWPIG